MNQYLRRTIPKVLGLSLLLFVGSLFFGNSVFESSLFAGSFAVGLTIFEVIAVRRVEKKKREGA